MPPLLNALANAFLAGEPDVEQIVARASRTLGRSWPWLRPVARSFVEIYAGQTRPRRRDVIQFFRNDPIFCSAWSQRNLRVAEWLLEAPVMQPVPAASAWDLPAIGTAPALAEWLAIRPEELDWFAALKGPRCCAAHYHYTVLPKGRGASRLIEAPKPRLKDLQRRILTGVLEKIPVPSAVHGFVKGRSVRTFAAPHAGQQVVLRMDLEDFFPSIPGVRIQALFRTLGYPEAVADLLGGICTNAVPAAVWAGYRPSRETRDLYLRPHLPQGTPTSPALANLCTYRVDCRLMGLANSAGAVYTRYADDLAFSGGHAFNQCVERFFIQAAAILMEDGFSVHHRKTRIMHQGVRQYLAGLAVNREVNVLRPDFDRLKATLTNCVRLGPASQNRENHPSFRAHLQGRVAFVESINPQKGRRLRGIFERIHWPSGIEPEPHNP
ncbi:MAG: reverse transcriptase family protein [Bryobacteraceae bacterium]